MARSRMTVVFCADNRPGKEAAHEEKKSTGEKSEESEAHPGGGARAIEFYKKAFGAAEVMRMPGPDGKLGHAEIRIGDSRVMLSDEYPEMAFMGPQTRGGSTVHIHLYVKDVDATTERAVAAGAKLIRPIEDKFYGDRTGSIQGRSVDGGAAPACREDGERNGRLASDKRSGARIRMRGGMTLGAPLSSCFLTASR